jgi:glycosyltransferase involved in cell wall biosynthesis
VQEHGQSDVDDLGKQLRVALTGRTILQIVPTLGTGGAERSAIEIAQALQRAGANAWIAAGPGRWSDWALRSGATLYPVNLGAKSPAVLRHFFWLRRLLQQVDIVHTRSRLPSWLTWLTLHTIPRARRPRWVTTVHGLHSVNRYSAIQHAGELAIAVSNTAKSYVLANYPQVSADHIQVIPRGADTENFYPKQNTADWTTAFHRQFPTLQGRRILLLAGRGTRLKGHMEALTLLAALRSSAADLALFFAGIVEANRSAYLEEVQQRARQLGLSDAVIFSEARPDLPALYAHAALVLQLSNRPESFGRTVAEALLCGAQVLGLDHGGVGEQLRAAFPAGLVETNNAAALEQRARDLLAQPQPAALAHVPSLVQMQQATLGAYVRLLSRD